MVRAGWIGEWAAGLCVCRAAELQGCRAAGLQGCRAAGLQVYTDGLMGEWDEGERRGKGLMNVGVG